MKPIKSALDADEDENGKLSHSSGNGLLTKDEDETTIQKLLREDHA